MSGETNKTSDEEVSAGFFNRIFRLIVSPRKMWTEIAGSKKREDEFLAIYFPALLLGTLGPTVGTLSAGTYYPFVDDATQQVFLKHVAVEPVGFLMQQFVLMLAYLMLPFLFAKPVSILVRAFQGGYQEKSENIKTARRFIQFSLAPAFCAMMFQAWPPLSIIAVLIIFHTFYIASSGISPLFGVYGWQKVFLLIILSVLYFFYVFAAYYVTRAICGDEHYRTSSSSSSESGIFASQ